MIIIYLLLPISLLLAAGFLWAFLWAVSSGQYDDTATPSMRVLTDEGEAPSRSSSTQTVSRSSSRSKLSNA